MSDSSAYQLYPDPDDMEPVLQPAPKARPVDVPEGLSASASSGLESATEQVWKALNGGSYDWRSVDGIAEETGLDRLTVYTILEKKLGEKVVQSTDKNQPGTLLYATRDRYNQIRGPWNRVLSVITNQVK